MTKTIVIGEVGQAKKRAPINFDKLLGENLKFESAEYCNPNDYKYIELVCRNYDGEGKGTDVMFAYDNPTNRSAGVLFIGQWNDGFVE